MPGIIRLDIHDIRRAGTIEQAIVAWARDQREIASGDADACNAAALAAMEGGARAYVDANDGKIIRAEAVPEGTDDDIYHEIGGGQFVPSEWSDHSVIELLCPDDEDVMQYPEIAAAMAEDAIGQHSRESDQAAWRRLIQRMTRLVSAWATLTHA
jgi:hypothetical protein